MVEDTPVRTGIAGSGNPIQTIVTGLPSEFKIFSKIEVTVSDETMYMEYEDSEGAYHMMEFKIKMDFLESDFDETDSPLVIEPVRPGLIGPPHKKFFEENGPVKVQTS